MAYIDSFLVPVPRSKLDEYRKYAELGAQVWREHGALDYREWLADDVAPGEVTSFPRAVQLRDDEVVVCAWVVYESRAHRDEVNDKVMKDPRMQKPPEAWPFDGKRLIFGGFAPLLPE